MRKSLLGGLLLLMSALFVPGQLTPDSGVSKQVSTTQSSDDSTNPGAAATDYVRPSSKQRFKWYIGSMIGPEALAKRAVSSGYATWRNEPEEWGDHWDGFGRRFAWASAGAAIKSTTKYGLEEAFKLDSHYYRSKDRGFKSKVSNALLSTVTARDEHGKRVFGYPRIVGTYTGSMVAAYAWLPDGDWKSGLRSGSFSLGMNAAFNLVKEFIKK